MSAALEHFCAGCGTARKSNLRYPWYFCKECLKLAENKDGARLEFGNMGLSGGLWWSFAGSDERNEVRRVGCQILKRPVIVSEAKFGGVVAEPTTRDELYRLEKAGIIVAL